AAAKAHLQQLQTIMARPELAEMSMEFNISRELLTIGEQVLSGWIAMAEQDTDAAIAFLEAAVQSETNLLYGEPPEWSVPVRQELGAALLKSGRAADAERVFKEDLAKFPENGWSLYGLMKAHEAQGENADAQAVRSTLDTVWATADVNLEAIF
ncbi:MAG: hypothetical protein MI746_12120, partial [Pseudomonadales bacterium]|nr:hypothetical protein [Pseudomonadales bacterium]